ncbi:unnamed protein product [Phyllotreta striolata]|uniref:alpha-glucosidase n=1 Tax=Phyllotreta striolata TaxID=444603 RepID=A0A9N9TYQ4_PHYSR|nr:unnamed protein product [Phyllotreta striolata]
MDPLRRTIANYKCIIILWVSIGVAVSVPQPSAVHDLGTNKPLDWWQNAVVYQIYPLSFKDSDGDGSGDLKGITSKLPYLQDLGVTAIWLTPIYNSSLYDQGYDVSNYTMILKTFGTMEDFDELIAEAKKLGIKVVLDFVPNHTSFEHEWFIKSKTDDNYKDYYIWRNGSSKNSPPNNWKSTFGGSAWTYDKDAKMYYYHQFLPQQPDLNYNNSNVVKKMKDVLTFWLDKGVSGFRMDAVPYLFEDPSLVDAPTPDGCDSGNCQSQLQITKDLPRTYDMIYQFREHLDDYVKKHKLNETKVMMTEAYTTPEDTVLYYQSEDGKRKGAHFTFNFNLIVYLNSNFTALDIIKAVEKWLVYLPSGATSNWVIGNHDNHRAASRVGERNVDAFNMLTAFLPGVMVTYNGEEMGMPDGEVTCAQGKDTSATKDCKTFNETSRDFERTPFQWDNTTYAGFSDHQPFLPVGSSKSYININAENQTGVNSPYETYKKLMKFRKEHYSLASVRDAVSLLQLSDGVMQIVRQRDDGEFVYLFNAGESKESVNFYSMANQEYKVLVSSTNSTRKAMETVQSTIKLDPHECLILQGYPSKSSSTPNPSSSTPNPTTTTPNPSPSTPNPSSSTPKPSNAVLSSVISIQFILISIVMHRIL